MDDCTKFLGCLNSLSKGEDIIIVSEIYYLTDEMLFFRLIVYIAHQRMVYLYIVRHISQQIADI